MSKGEPRSNGKSVRRAAGRQFQSARGDLKYVEVPEWPDEEGNPSRVYYRERLTIRDLRRVNADLMAEGDGVNPITLGYSIFRVCALDSLGNPMFPDEDSIDYFEKNFDPNIVIRLVEEMSLGEGLFNRPEVEPGKDLDPTQETL